MLLTYTFLVCIVLYSISMLYYFYFALNFVTNVLQSSPLPTQRYAVVCPRTGPRTREALCALPPYGT